MMGNRGAKGGCEIDALSRRSRRLLQWRPGQVKKLKRSFAKRTRHEAKVEARHEALQSGALTAGGTAVDETTHLLSSPRNAERLAGAIAELDRGRGQDRELLEP